MSHRYIGHGLAMVLALGPMASQPAFAGSYVIDDFSSPVTANSYSLFGAGTIVDTVENVPNPRRLFGVSSGASQVNTITSGNGGLTFASTGVATSAVQFSVAPVGGGTVDVTPYNYVRLHFLRLAEGLNLNAEFFTAYSPTGYYIDSAVNSGAPTNGGPFDVYIPIAFQPGFDATSVGGFYLGIEGTSSGAGEQYALASYSLTTGVPEPAGWALLVVGFAAVGAAARRRRVITVSA